MKSKELPVWSNKEMRKIVKWAYNHGKSDGLELSKKKEKKK